MNKLSLRYLLAFVLIVWSCPAEPATAQGRKASFVSAANRPKLILQITVDQLRGDLPFRYQDRFGPGGFRLLMDQGTWYTAANHPHSNTETIVGHTTLATGAYPS